MFNINNLKFTKVLREIPGKRRVVEASARDKNYIVKFFKKKNLYAKEIRGSFYLNQAEILTPKIVSFGKLKNEYYIIFEKIIDAITVEEFLNGDETLTKKHNIINEILLLNKKLFKKNFIQLDNYFKNYLISHEKIYIIDGGLVKKIIFFKALRKFLNFSLISSKVDPDIIPNKTSFYNFKILDFIHKKIVSYYVHKSLMKFQFKTLRNSSQFEKTSTFRSLIYKQKDFNFDFQKIDNLLQNAEIIKNGNTCTVFCHKNLVIKRYNIKSFKHFIKLQFIKSRGKNSWQISNALQLINIPCPKPYFYYEKKFLFFRLGSYFAMEKINGIDIVSYQESIKKNSDTKVLKEKIFKLFDKFIYFKFIHGDFKKTNILVDNKMKISMIDFDKSFFSMSQSIYNYKIKNQIARFLSNWKNKSKFLTAIRSLEKII